MALTTELLDNQFGVREWSLIVMLVLVYGISSIFFDEIPHKNVALVGKTGWEVSNSKAKMRYMMSARQIIGQGFEKVNMYIPVECKGKMNTKCTAGENDLPNDIPTWPNDRAALRIS
jgi:hypothetical protein